MAAALIFSPLPAAAEAQGIRIEIAGLLGEKAVLIIDGKQKILRAGETSAEGIKLIAVEAEGVTLEVGGRAAIIRWAACRSRPATAPAPGRWSAYIATAAACFAP